VPRVSVVIPAYNAERFVAQTLESVLRQTYRDFEVIVIDDGSRDGTAAIAESFGTPVRCVRQDNGGVSRARNTGIREAAGEYVAFLDADDLWEPTKLECQVSLLETRGDVGLCFTGLLRVDPSLRPLGVTPGRAYADYCEALLLYSCVVPCSSTLVRRRALDQVGGFDPAFSTSADWDFLLRMSRRVRFAPIADPLLIYRVTPGSMCSDSALLERDTFAVLEKFYGSDGDEYRPIRGRCYSNYWMILSGCYLHAGHRADSLRCLANAVHLNPRHAGRALATPLRWLRRCLLGHPNLYH
jgi:glycosyltransferase involved in cell wall biosynthesis